MMNNNLFLDNTLGDGCLPNFLKRPTNVLETRTHVPRDKKKKNNLL